MVKCLYIEAYQKRFLNLLNKNKIAILNLSNIQKIIDKNKNQIKNIIDLKILKRKKSSNKKFEKLKILGTGVKKI